jgi:hypothetical protein
MWLYISISPPGTHRWQSSKTINLRSHHPSRQSFEPSSRLPKKAAPGALTQSKKEEVSHLQTCRLGPPVFHPLLYMSNMSRPPRDKNICAPHTMDISNTPAGTDEYRAVSLSFSTSFSAIEPNVPAPPARQLAPTHEL